jgi:hypothetical protein
MEKLIWCGVCVAAMLGGGYMTLWPAEAAVQNRDDKDDTSPPTAHEVGFMRAVGVILAVAGAYFLYQILSGAPGAEDPNLI